MSLFTPKTGVIGGSLIGLSASSLLVLNGDILGFSGLIRSVGLNIRESMHQQSLHWKLVWLSTFMLAVNFYINHVEDATRDPRLETSGMVPIASTTAHVLGGALVGLGTTLSNGCTSGHGVCGLARRSRRSLVAVPLFMISSMLTAAAISFKDGPLYGPLSFMRTTQLHIYSKILGTLTTGTVVSWGLLRTTRLQKDEKVLPAEQNKVFGAAVSAVMAALGLVISGMTRKSKVNDFLDVCALCRVTKALSGSSDSEKEWDLTLMSVMGSAMLFSFLGYQFVPGPWRISWLFPASWQKERPAWGGEKHCVPTSTTIGLQLVAGSVLFGIGWGATGLCPGPALYHAAAGMADVVLAWFPAFFAGSWAGLKLKAYLESGEQHQKSKQA